MGGDSALVARSELNALVLQPDDLSGEFERFDEGAQRRADQPAGARADPARFGRQGGWMARYRRPGSGQTRGPILVESRADLFEDSGGAREDLEAHRSEVEGALRLLETAPELGDEAFAATILQGGDRGVRFYFVAWREANVTASVFVNGFEGKLTLEETLDLARKQQRRIEGAVS
jgi:hypothetical protein